MSKSTSKSKSPRPERAAGTHGRLYIFLVVALALFVGIVVTYRRPPTSFTARVEIEQSGEHPALNSRESIAQAIHASHDEHAADWHSADGHSHTNETEQHPGQPPHLLVEVQPHGSGQLVSICCNAASADHALEETAGLAETYVRQFEASAASPQDCPECKKAAAATAAARHAMQLAREDLTAFEVKHADVLNEQGEPAEVVPPPSIAPAEDPAVAEIRERIKVLNAARAELLIEKMEAHPAVRDLQWQIEKLESELALLKPAPVEPLLNEPTPADGPSPELLEQLAKLQAAAATAHRRYEAAQAVEKLAVQNAASRTAAVANITNPAEIVGQRGAGASRTAVLGGGILALLLGCIVAWRSQRVIQPAELISAMQVESLGVPVVATIRTDDGPELPAPRLENPTWIGWLTFACELAVAAIAVTMVLLLLADWQMIDNMVRDPLSALAEALGRLW